MGLEAGEFRLSLLGAFQLRSPDGERISIASKKGTALLAMLAVANEGERTRAWLQEKLWGSRHHIQARNSLRRELSDLRKRLNTGSAELLSTEGDRVRLNLRKVRVDARERWEARGAAGAVDGPADEFLEGLDIAGEDGFEEWLRQQRSTLKEAAGPRAGPGAHTNGAAGASDPAQRPEVERDSRERPAIAVLSFERRMSGVGDDALAEILPEQIISGLANSRLLAVCARQTSLAFDPRGLSASEIAAALRVEYLVQGQVQQIGETVRIAVDLVHGPQDRTIWSTRFDRPAKDIFILQDQITREVIGRLEPAVMGHEETQTFQRSSRNPRHWDLFIKGRWHFWRATFQDWAKARGYLVDALALEPDDVPTLTMLALCELGEVWAGVADDPAASIADAHRLGLRAVALDGSDAYAHSILGTVLSFLGRDEQAVAEQKRALELNPYLAAAAGELGRLFVFAGDLDAAVAYSDQAIAASPNDAHAFLWFRSKALAAFIRRQYVEAARHAADACAHGPHQFFLHYLQAACHAAAGDDVRARIAIDEGRRLQPRYTLAMIRLAYPFANKDHLDRYVEALRMAGWNGGEA